MKCRICGASLQATATDLPFKVSDSTIIVIKALPVLQCRNCAEYLLEDAVMAVVERILENADAAAELEVVRYAA